MRIVICGVRGSTPASGRTFLRYGGHTSCIAVAHDGEQDPTLLLDGGTGLTNVTELLGGRSFRGSLLLGHLHWDHTHGMPFFPGGAQTDSRVTVLLPEQGEDAEAVLSRAFSPPHFPVLPRVLGPGWSFAGLEPGLHVLEGFTVLAREIPHKGGRTYGYRVTDGTSSLAYLSDHSPVAMGPGPDGLGEYHEAALELADGVDLLIHDAQHTAEEFPAQAYLGHASVEYVVGLAAASGARSVLLFHHAPGRTDDEIDVIVAGQAGAPVPVHAAAEGHVIELGAAAADPAPAAAGAVG
jgi:phosphoribosyl 1,2-cyclic phosphodiesterase